MIEGVAIRLRAWQEDDIPLVSALRNDMALQVQLLSRVRGSEAGQIRNWLQDRSGRADCLFFIIADRETNAALGYLQIGSMDLVDQRAELGICLMREAQGRGIGYESIRLAISYLQNTWGLRKLSLKVRDDNVAAIRSYQRVGFVKCGLLREHVFIDGSWHDIVLMDLFFH